MKKFFAYLFGGPRAPISPIAAQYVNADKFVMCIETKAKLYRCLYVLEEIRDLGNQPLTMELRIAIKGCLRDIDKQEEDPCH